MTTISTIFLVLIALLVATLIALYVIWQRNEEAQKVEKSRCEARIVELEESLASSQQNFNEERIAHVRTQSERDALKQSLEQLRTERETSERTMKSEFKNLANEILVEHQHHLRQANRDSLDLLLKPFKDNITEFRERVERIYAHENEQRGALKNELDNLIKLNQQMTSSAANLTDALKGNSKVQGDWGEVILETILDNSNLIRGVHYQTQLNVKDETGSNLRPDVVLYLPNNKQIVIDSKVSLTAYVNYVSAQTEAERRVAMAAHIASVRQHVKELSAKKYQQLMQSPDFVVMFVPNEPAFLDALKEDHTIWSDAYDKKVVVSSPTNLFALLKLVDDLWRRDDQTKNQENIIKFGVTLYEQLVAFTAALEGVGAGLEQARAKYDEAYKRLHTGNNNIVRLGERLKKLGLPTKKQQTAKALAEADVEE